MKYQVKMLIKQNILVVAKNYLNKELMFKWMHNLLEIKEENGVLFEKNSTGFLVFDQMKMKITINESNLPHLITATYEIPYVKNICINHFIEQDNDTLWVMDVTFDFEKEMNLDQNLFIEKTRSSMQIYKEFIEGCEQTL
jgi:hypothetical protein